MTVALRLLSLLVSAAAATGQSPLAPTPEYATFGSGCAGSQPAPHLALMPVGSGVRWATAPVTGGVMCVELTGMPSPTGFLITGASRTLSPLGPLPLGLAAYGMPSCDLHVSPDSLQFVHGAASRATYLLGIPASPGLAGLQFHQQAFVLDPSAGNSAGAVMSNAAVATVCTPADYFSIVVLPDTQYYSRSYPATYLAQGNWIVQNLQPRNIRFVVHVGDVTNDNVANQWANAVAAQSLFDGLVPCGMVPGNHDMVPNLHRRDYTNLNNAFPPGPAGNGFGYLGGRQNTFTTFDHGGLQFLVLGLEFVPRKHVLQWANEVVAQHPHHRVVVVTHSYQEKDGSYDTGGDDDYNAVGSDGAELWDEFVSRHSNVFLVLSGHNCGSIHRQRSDTSFGNVVHEVLTDFQCEGGSNGNGWLRLLTFNTRLGTVQSQVLTVLPSFPTLLRAAAPYFDYPASPTDPQHAFVFDYDMSSPTPVDRWDPSNARFGDMTVNTVVDGDQTEPCIDIGGNGEFVVAWQDSRRGDVYARGFVPGGWQNVPDVRVNPVATGGHRHPAVAVADNGDSVVVWEDDRDGDGVYTVWARGFTTAGATRFVIPVDATAGGQQLAPDVAIAPNGDFVVAWQDGRAQNGDYDVWARGFLANASPRHAALRVTATSGGQQLAPRVGADAAGNFTVVWEDDPDGNGIFAIAARGFFASGNQRTVGVTVNTLAGNGQHIAPDVGVDASGNFVVVWQDDSDDNDLYEIRARGFHAGATNRLAEFPVNTVGSGQQRRPSLSMDDTGDFVVAWEDDADGNGFYQILARGFHASGGQRFADRTVNGDSSGQQLRPAVALRATGNWVAIWQDDLDEDGLFDVLARGF